MPVAPMSADAVHQLLVEKAHRQYADLAAAFRAIGNSANGVITRADLRNLLGKFMIRTTAKEFASLWKR